MKCVMCGKETETETELIYCEECLKIPFEVVFEDMSKEGKR